MSDKKIRVLIAKPGLDGHDQGAKVVVRALMDAGMEVIYTGLRQSPEAVANTAAQEDVDVIGLSSMAGSHIPFCKRLKELIDENDLGDKLWLIGGNIPPQDHEEVLKIGVDAIFAQGSKMESFINYIRENVK
jgi:methylmalonyl-CoA mutase C-terminal domain/subunit